VSESEGFDEAGFQEAKGNIEKLDIAYYQILSLPIIDYEQPE
jgi:hypothetical protein